MAVYAIADLHLSHATDKPMDVFGPTWRLHTERLADAWRETVLAEDTVLIPGDISWAMTLPDALPDLEWIARLPGCKVLLRGNHDYWWSGITKVRRHLPPAMVALQNDAVRLVDGSVICGSRGWMLPSHPKFSIADEIIYVREIERLRLSLQAARRLGSELIAMMHYPPTDAHGAQTPFTSLLEQFSVRTCVYGHLHGAAQRFAFEGELGGVTYQLVSADAVGFTPVAVQDSSRSP